MKKLAIIVIAISILSPIKVGATELIPLPQNRVALGAYDHTGKLDDITLDCRQEFFPWEKTDDMKAFIEWSLAHHSVPVIGLYGEKTTGSNVLHDTASGSNDRMLDELATMFKQVAPQQVVVRLWYEMELPRLNPWYGTPAEFIPAYQHVITLMRKHEVTNVLWMWSPAGNREAKAYYPGNSYVDAIGFTVLSSDVWDAKSKLTPRDFKELFEEKYNFFKGYGKPMWIAEMGVSRPSNAQKQAWLDSALDYLKSAPHPLLQGIMYFNEPNPVNIFSGDNPPDWTLTADMFWKPNDMPALKTAS